MFRNIILFENFDQGVKLPKFVDLAPVTPCKVSGLYMGNISHPYNRWLSLCSNYQLLFDKLACTKNKYYTQEGDGNPARIRQVSVCIVDILKHVWENQALFATPQD